MLDMTTQHPADAAAADAPAPAPSSGTVPAPTRMGSVGSAERIALLLHLAKHPAGLGTKALAQAVGIGDRQAIYLLNRLRVDHRVVSEGGGRGHAAVWHVPAVRRQAARQGGTC